MEYLFRFNGVPLLLFGAILNSMSQILLDGVFKGLGEERSGWTSLVYQVLSTPRFWMACCATGLFIVVWCIALTRISLQVALPTMALAFVITPLWRVLQGHETVEPSYFAGAAFVVVGVAIVAGSR